MLDRSAAEPFGYMLLAQKYPTVMALLYFNTVEQYKLFPKGLDMWHGETFNFGGSPVFTDAQLCPLSVERKTPPPSVPANRVVPLTPSANTN